MAVDSHSIAPHEVVVYSKAAQTEEALENNKENVTEDVSEDTNEADLLATFPSEVNIPGAPEVRGRGERQAAASSR